MIESILLNPRLIEAVPDRLLAEHGSGAAAVQADDSVTCNRKVSHLEDRVRELERQLGRKPLGIEILKEAPGLLRLYERRED